MICKMRIGVLCVICATGANTREIDLHGTWRLSGSDEKGGAIECPIAVPGGVHSALLRAGLMVDPFYGRNELKTQWVGRKDWTISRTFEVGDDILAKKAVVLRLDNVDTFATISVNGNELGKTDNRFRRWEFDVKLFLKKGANEIRGDFESSEMKAHELAKTYDHAYHISCVPWATDQAVIRKPACHAGWDWGLAQIAYGGSPQIRFGKMREDEVFASYRSFGLFRCRRSGVATVGGGSLLERGLWRWLF